MTRKRKLEQGFTLIEAMIVVGIIAILSAIAYPSYTQFIARGHRADARATVLDAAQYMERQYSTQGAYQDALPARLLVSPAGAGGAQQRYTVTVTTSVSAYTLSAAPIGADPCGTLTLTNTGVKGRLGAGLSVAECWR